MEPEISLSCKDLVKTYPGVIAMDHINFELRKGEVHALLGENGAGKSTLIKSIAGAHQCDSGTITIDGKEFHSLTPLQAKEMGVEVVYQEFNQMPSLSVAENIYLTELRGKRIVADQREFERKAAELFKEMNLDLNPKVKVASLTNGYKQMVEIAKAVSYNAKVIVFDEPTSSLTEDEVAHLFRIINMLRDQGCAIVYISHKMKEILEISDEVTIMRDGKWIATRESKDLTTNEIIKLMVGRELTNLYPPKSNVPGDVLLEVDDLSAEYSKLRDVSFKAHRGEIIGVAGLDGSGRTELLENIFGTATRRSGTLTLDGKRIKNRSARESIKNGFALLTEERRATGIFGILNIRDNATISSLGKCSSGPFLSKKKMKKSTDWCIKAMNVKTPNQETKIRSLSGGNQQKVILGRWLLTDPTVLLLDEPTRGIDVGAKYEIYQLIIDLAARGKTVIMVSSEMPELLGVCDRILVMSGGRLAGEVDAKTATQEDIMTLAAQYA